MSINEVAMVSADANVSKYHLRVMISSNANLTVLRNQDIINRNSHFISLLIKSSILENCIS